MPMLRLIPEIQERMMAYSIRSVAGIDVVYFVVFVVVFVGTL